MIIVITIGRLNIFFVVTSLLLLWFKATGCCRRTVLDSWIRCTLLDCWFRFRSTNMTYRTSSTVMQSISLMSLRSGDTDDMRNVVPSLFTLTIFTVGEMIDKSRSVSSFQMICLVSHRSSNFTGSSLQLVNCVKTWPCWACWCIPSNAAQTKISRPAYAVRNGVIRSSCEADTEGK